MRRSSLFGLVGGIALAALAGCRATPPSRAEDAVVQWVKHNITVKGTHDKNPIPSTPDKVESGKQTFAFYCIVCHGRDGQNTGVPFANSISPPIPSLASPRVQSYTDGQLKWIIEHGIAPSGMPGSKGILSDDDMWTIVVYLRHLPPAGSLGEPRTYTGDEYAK
jgi:mono/diheme cytochrome c family protein